MTILQAKEVMWNKEKSPKDTALTMKEVKHYFPFQKTPFCTSTYQLTNYLSLGLDRAD